MEFIPYATQSIDDADVDAVCAALRSGWLTQGPTVPRFEEAFARQHAVPHAIAVCNATAALHIACLALDVGPGGIVWTSPNSYVASANCAMYCGASVDFVDIDPITRNMSVSALREKLTEARRADRLPTVLIPVHFAGLPCDLAEMRALADEYGFAILADASHAVGADYQGAPVASRFADISVFSFHPVKIITTGEGGMVTTHRADLAARLRILRTHGVTREPQEMLSPPPGPWYYEQQVLGYNYRLTEIQAALGESQLRRLPQLAARRKQLAERYPALLSGLPLRLAPTQADRESSWHLYVVEVDATSPVSRDDAFMRLRADGVGVNLHYQPIHLQPFYRERGFSEGMFPCAEAYGKCALSIPLYPALTDAQQDHVASALRRALA